MTDEEIDEIVWEQKRQKAIKQLQELPRGQHFATFIGTEDHEDVSSIVVGCPSFVSMISLCCGSILMKTILGGNTHPES